MRNVVAVLGQAMAALRGPLPAGETRPGAPGPVGPAEPAVDVERSKLDFLLLASHELRGPLTVARGYATMLADGTLAGAPVLHARALAVIDEQLTGMGRLIDRMLQATSAGDRAPQDDRQALDLPRAVVQAAARSVAGRARPLRLSVQGHAVAHANRTEVDAVLDELLDNCAKYAPDTEVRCEIRSVPGGVEVRVRDGGPGLSPGDLRRLFTAFGRVVTSETSNVPGGGLGLFLARAIARRNGGDLRAESHPGAGATFVLTLPALP